MAVTIHPIVEKLDSTSSMRVPVREKNVPKTWSCMRKASPVMIATIKVSTTRSVTTVPIALGKDVPSHLRSTPQRATSPTRGMTRLTA